MRNLITAIACTFVAAVVPGCAVDSSSEPEPVADDKAAESTEPVSSSSSEVVSCTTKCTGVCKVGYYCKNTGGSMYCCVKCPTTGTIPEACK